MSDEPSDLKKSTVPILHSDGGLALRLPVEDIYCKGEKEGEFIRYFDKDSARRYTRNVRNYLNNAP